MYGIRQTTYTHYGYGPQRSLTFEVCSCFIFYEEDLMINVLVIIYTWFRGLIKIGISYNSYCYIIVVCIVLCHSHRFSTHHNSDLAGIAVLFFFV